MTYPYHDLREYLDDLDRRGLLVRVQRPVDKDCELVPLVRLQFRGLPAAARRGFSFEQVTDGRGRCFDGTVAIATFAASPEMYGLAVGGGVRTPGEAWGRALANPIPPVAVAATDAACKEVVLDPDELDRTGGVDAFPHPISTPGFDPAPFLTAGCWITRDVEDGSYNAGIYRGMVKGPRRIGLQMDTPSQHIAIHLAKARRAGRQLEVAIVIGAVPALALSSAQKLPYGTSEYELAGGLTGRPLEVTRCETVDIEVPAQAEIVIEGVIDPTVVEPEGPFGETSGYMGGRTWSPVVEVTCITHRRHPVVQAFISEFPPSESTLMRKIGFENVYFRHLRDNCNIASVRKVTFYEAASVNMLIVVQLDHPTPGQSMQALYAVAGYEPSMGKIIVAVDEDIEAADLENLVWALSYRVQPARDVVILPGRLPRLDPSVPAEDLGTAASSAMLIDATRGRDFPPTSLPAPPQMERAIELWAELGLPELTLREPWSGRELGGWTDENRQEAARALLGDYLSTGDKLRGRQRPYEP